MQEEKTIAQQSTALMFAAAALVLLALLALDLTNRGLVWRALRALRGENTTSLPGEDRTIGEQNRTDVTFLS